MTIFEKKAWVGVGFVMGHGSPCFRDDSFNSSLAHL